MLTPPKYATVAHDGDRRGDLQLEQSVAAPNGQGPQLVRRAHDSRRVLASAW